MVGLVLLGTSILSKGLVGGWSAEADGYTATRLLVVSSVLSTREKDELVSLRVRALR